MSERVYNSEQLRDTIQPLEKDGTPNDDFFKVMKGKRSSEVMIGNPEVKKFVQNHPEKYKNFLKYNK